MRHIVEAASLTMPGLFLHPQSNTWYGVVDILMDRNLNWRVFGGQWVLPWKHYLKAVASYFGINTLEDALAFTTFAERAGALVTFR